MPHLYIIHDCGARGDNRVSIPWDIFCQMKKYEVVFNTSSLHANDVIYKVYLGICNIRKGTQCVDKGALKSRC